ncbi:ClpP family protease [Sediminivirga luteola]|uniref:ATP-dependent Clp protease proteolytic subunit n=1 Tax=Sediminivirga luteola TaxID=1774748 RepID=A0A8J2U081_9MICO|nr:ATP-dependent Clp protease proteolytic subunit [Sediminivirga luteola]GGA23708.1 putative ATP-dependent Clp protease proteolytic subunit-like protein [Sediminivirga luteola]
MSTYTIPNVVSRDGRGERIVDVYSRLLEGRIIYLGTGIDDGVANAVIAQLLHLDAESTDQPINLYINSPGGSLTAVLAIYDTMRYTRAPIATTCIGQAVADAALLLAAGEPGRRSILPHGRVVPRQPQTEGGRAAIPDLIVAADEVIRQRDQIERVLASLTGKEVSRLRRDMDRDMVLTAEGARDYGVVDRIAGST